MKKLLCALAAVAIAAPGIALAGAGGTSCAAAQEIFPQTTYSGNTTGNPNFIGVFGALPSPGPDAVYKFTSDGQVTTSINVTITGGWNAGIFLTATCAGNAGNIIEAATGPAATFSMPIDNGSGGPLAAGTTYYVTMSGNPADNSGPSGAYSFGTPNPLPVTLQEFSID